MKWRASIDRLKEIETKGRQTHIEIDRQIHRYIHREINLDRQWSQMDEHRLINRWPNGNR